MKEYDILNQREYEVRKRNELIQQSKNELNLREQKVLAFLLSKIKPSDEPETEYEFSISDFCKTCGITYNGQNENEVLKALQDIYTKGLRLKVENTNKYVFMHILDRLAVSFDDGKITIGFDKLIVPFLFGIDANFTRYRLLQALPMQSKYSIKLFELLKSYSHQRGHCFELQELKNLIDADKETYSEYKFFRIKVLEPAIEEINKYGDIWVSYEPIRNGRKIAKLNFIVKIKDIDEQMDANLLASAKLENYQFTVDDLF